MSKSILVGNMGQSNLSEQILNARESLLVEPVCFTVVESEMICIKQLLKEAQMPQVTFSLDYDTMRKEAEYIRTNNVNQVLSMLEKYGG